MSFIKNIISKYLKILITVVLIASAIGFVGKQSGEKLCRDILVNIKEQHDNFFVDRDKVLALMTNDFNQNFTGLPLMHIDLEELEHRILANPYVREVQVYKDMKGYIIADVTLRRPVARLLKEDEDLYIDQDGNLFPTSDQFTSRVLLLGGEGIIKMMAGNKHEKLAGSMLGMIRFINDHEFWSKQISQIEMDNKGYLTMWPQVTKQWIEFGTIENYEKKFKKLKIFYDQILPRKGWNSYERVNVEYKDQIICE